VTSQSASHTGTTIDSINALRIAQHRGATTISITNYEMSPIAAVSDLHLTTAARETTFSIGGDVKPHRAVHGGRLSVRWSAQRSYDRAIEALDSKCEVAQTRHIARV
jgi:hypothetical protein